MNTEKAITSYLEFKHDEVSPSTYRMYEWAFKKLKKFMADLPDTDSVTLEDILEVRKKIKAVSTDSTYNYIWGRLKEFLKFWNREDIAKKLTSVKQREVSYEKYEMSQMRMMSEKMDQPYKSLFVFLLSSGLRIGESGKGGREALFLRRGDINMERGKGKVLGKGRGSKESFWFFKFGKEALKTLLLEKDLKESDYLFQKNGRPLKYHDVWTYFKKIAKECGIKDFTTHKTRHTIGTWMLDNGYSLRDVRDFLRHKNIKTTSKYLDIGEKDLLEKMGKKSPWEST